jgi:glutamine amidotransferase
MTGPSVAIIDGGGANIASLQNAFRRIGANATLTSDVETIMNASHVVLPGVGAAAPAMHRLEDAGLIPVIRKLTQPVLGICLGMQLLGRHSAEDDVDCIGVFPGTSARLVGGPGLPVPNMGWCRVQHSGESPLFDDIPSGSWFYFVHSYALPLMDCTVGTTGHGVDFSSVLASENFHAVQFHPERSSAAGSKLLQNFLGIAA